MAYTPATKFPTLSQIAYFQWSTPTDPNPRLARGISATDTELFFTSAPKDKDGTVITTPFWMNVKNKYSYTETIYCANGANGASGLSATGCVRGINPTGIDYTTGNTSFAAEADADSPIACNIPPVLPNLLVSAIQGSIASGGSGLIFGTDTAGTITLSRTKATIINDSYSETNYSADNLVRSGSENYGQCFTASINGTLNSMKFYLKKYGTPTGSAYAKIYAMTGTYGTSGKPTGTALATSDAFDVSTLTTSYVLSTLTFSGVEQITLTAGTYYVAVLTYSGGDTSNWIYIGVDSSAPSHSGNWAYSATGTPWVSSSSYDTIFYVYTKSNAGWMRWYTTTGKVQYSNDGMNWVNQDDVTASDLAKVSAADTTAGYLENKIIAGTDITITKNNTGGNENLSIATNLPAQVTSHIIYTPAYLTGDTGAQSNYLLWLGTLDGSFRLTLDGTAYNVDGISFAGCTSMADVATKIQTKLQTVTGTSATCAWSTNHFVITSANTTATSAITVLSTSTGTVGTDISGAGASDWMDADTGNGVVTNKVINAAADVGKIALMAADGYLDAGYLANQTSSDGVIPPVLDATYTFGQNFFTAGESINGVTTPVPVFISDGTGGYTAGKYYKSDANDDTHESRSFYGFVKHNITTGDSGYPIYQGVVGGFAGLTIGAFYYVTDTVGTISATMGTSEICVGRAISATQIDTNDRPQGMEFISSANATGDASGSTATAPAIARFAIIRMTTPDNSVNEYGGGSCFVAKKGSAGSILSGANGSVQAVTATWVTNTITFTTTGAAAMNSTPSCDFYR